MRIAGKRDFRLGARRAVVYAAHRRRFSNRRCKRALSRPPNSLHASERVARSLGSRATAHERAAAANRRNVTRSHRRPNAAENNW